MSSRLGILDVLRQKIYPAFLLTCYTFGYNFCVTYSTLHNEAPFTKIKNLLNRREQNPQRETYKICVSGKSDLQVTICCTADCQNFNTIHRHWNLQPARTQSHTYTDIHSTLHTHTHTGNNFSKLSEPSQCPGRYNNDIKQFHTEDSQILSATVRNSVTTAN